MKYFLFPVLAGVIAALGVHYAIQFGWIDGFAAAARTLPGHMPLEFVIFTVTSLAVGSLPAGEEGLSITIGLIAILLYVVASAFVGAGFWSGVAALALIYVICILAVCVLILLLSAAGEKMGDSGMLIDM